ncbi:MAG: bifunctional 5,6,7,8-tetrahydromethanopterin hydro-lyase/3-hexulose-6-phosphate synthase [Candidatus Bathyarchaeia archaeon]
MFAVGEALIGSGGEVAHVDLLVGDKNGPVGQAFANGMAQLSQGHTPLLAVIRPNLLTKPCTLIIPKVTVKDSEQASKVFGPAQYAVAKAVADSVEEGVIPADKLDEWVIVCGVFVHPEAKDYRKIYQYNYGATRLALKRALENYPGMDKIMYEKDRAVHPIMGFRVPRLWKPPYLQVALDIPDVERVKQVVRQIPSSDQLILEAGTPLIKKYGVRVVRELREVAGNAFIIADLKTMDVGQVEVDLAFEETADAVVVSGRASKQTIEKFIDEAKKCGIYAFLDLSNVEDPIALLKSLKESPEVVLIHRPIDTEQEAKQRWELIKGLKKAVKRKILVAVAGGITPENVQEVLKLGADIIVVGRYITQSRDVTHAAREFLKYMGEDIDLFRVHYATE